MGLTIEWSFKLLSPYKKNPKRRKEIEERVEQYAKAKNLDNSVITILSTEHTGGTNHNESNHVTVRFEEVTGKHTTTEHVEVDRKQTSHPDGMRKDQAEARMDLTGQVVNVSENLADPGGSKEGDTDLSPSLALSRSLTSHPGGMREDQTEAQMDLTSRVVNVSENFVGPGGLKEGDTDLSLSLALSRSLRLGNPAYETTH